MSVKVPAQYNGGYTGGLTVEQCDNLLAIKQSTAAPEFEHAIFCFPYELILKSIETGESIRSIIKKENIDWSQYIGTLRPYQTVGAKFLINSKHAMIGDGVGLGKTAEISATINVLKQWGQLTKFMMAVESSALMQTMVELVKFTGLNLVVFPGETPKIKKLLDKTDWSKVDGIIIKHATLKNNTFMLWLSQNLDPLTHKSKMFNTLIIDESTVIKNSTTQISTYSKSISNMMERTYMMNATSFEKHIMDIYYQFDILDNALLPEISYINKNYCTYSRGYYWTSEVEYGVRKPVRHDKWDLSGYKNQDDFKQRLKYVYFGRSIEEVGMAAENIYKIYTVQPTPAQQQLIAAGFHSNEVLNCPTLLDEYELETEELKPIPLDRANNPKLNRLCDLAMGELEKIPFMVYCWHIKAQYAIKEELEKLGRKCVIINGEDPKGKDKDMEKLKRMQDFNSGVYDVVITNLQKSLNLPGAQALILYSNTATVGRLEQIRGRIDRHVDDKPRTFIMLLYEHSSEYTLMTEVAKFRGQASRDLILDSKTAIDHFMAAFDGE